MAVIPQLRKSSKSYAARFKVGNRVQLNYTKFLSAKRGSKAVVTGVETLNDMLLVRWLRSDKRHGEQADGAYMAYRFSKRK